MNIAQPRWKEPQYTRREINNAGDVMRDINSTAEQRRIAIQIIDNWRSAHAYPLQIFYMHLHRMQGTRNDVVVAQRLKRLNSITNKLIDQPEMELWRMHDLGGCRIVFPTLKEVFNYSDRLRKSRIRHEFKRQYDYIDKPKNSGYRSLHLVYKFHSDTPSKEAYNKNMLIELQFRTHLQHIWATALETIGLFTHQALKAGRGSEDILRFFVIVSSLFAMREHCAVVPGTLNDKNELISEIEEINDRIHVVDMLQGIRAALNADAQRRMDKRGYYILTLNYERQTIQTLYFNPSETEKASDTYNLIEQNSEGKPIDSVLVRASSLSAVRSVYPNYFLDIGEFVSLIREYLR